MQFLLRTAYFLLVGWWLALLWGVLGYLCCLSLVLLPLGTVMLNRIPLVLTLQPTADDPATGRPPRQLPLLVRAVWFFVAGWWLGKVCFIAGYVCCLTIIGMPLGVWLLHRVPEVLTLKQTS